MTQLQLDNVITAINSRAKTTEVNNGLVTKVDKNTDITAGTRTKITYDNKGLVTAGTDLISSDIPNLDTSKLTTGTLSVARGGTGVATSTGTGSVVLSTSPTLVTPSIGVATGTSFNSITGLSSTTPIVAGTATIGTGTTAARADHIHPVQTTITGNAGTATTLQTARNISGVSFNGSANIEIEDRLGTPIASAATTTIGTRGLGDYIHITGTTTITSLGTAAASGVRRTLIFDAALTLTHNATSLICPGASNIVTVAGTVIEVVAETTANWRVVSITHPSLSMVELGYLDGVTSAIQTQFTGKADSSHTHGNITNAGAIGATANLPIITTTSGVLQAGSFGTTANTFCQGNDTRLATNLAIGTRTTTAVPVTSSTGTNVDLPAATTTLAGVMTSADKTKLDGIAASANNYVLPTATSTVKGGVELFSDTVQSVAASEVTATASRTYGIQLNSVGQAVVNVPWVDTNTTYAVATTSANGLMSSTDKTKLDGVAAGAQVNVATNLAITAGTTAGPIVTSSTGTSATLPTASATASGVVTTDAQSWAGVKTFTSNPISTATQSTAVNALTRRDFVTELDSTNVKRNGNQLIEDVKTFSSSPIVPIATTDFQAIPARSTNITVTVGLSNSQYLTINAALEYLSGFYPLHKTAGVTATINLLSGFVMAEQVLVRGLNLGWITITGVDAETNITHTTLTTNFEGSYPAFGVTNGGTLPVINQLFNMNLGVSGAASNKHGVMAFGAGSSAIILVDKGVKKAGTHGIVAINGASIAANGANASGAGSAGIIASRSSNIAADGVDASGAGTYGIYAQFCSKINANSANASGAGAYGIYAQFCSKINARSANASGAGTTGIFANEGATINAALSFIQNQSSDSPRISTNNGSHIEASSINTTGGTSTVLSQTANTLTGSGIIYQ